MAAAKSRPRGWWYPWIFVGGMAVVIIVNAVMITLALDTFPGLETKDHYRKGLAYNEALEATKAQTERGWSMAPTLALGQERQGELRVAFADKVGQALEDLRVKAFLIRPTHEGHDFEVPLRHAGGGLYTGSLTVPLPGQWNLRVHARRGKETFQDQRKIEVR